MAHSLIAGDAAFAVVLSAWWQLRRSAQLLPHLRRGPSSFLFNPGYSCFSGIMGVIALQPLLTLHRPRRPTRHMATRHGHAGRGAAVPDRTQTPATRPSSEPPTCPFPVVELRSSRQGTPAIGPQAGSRAESGTQYVEPPTQPTVARRGSP